MILSQSVVCMPPSPPLVGVHPNPGPSSESSKCQSAAAASSSEKPQSVPGTDHPNMNQEATVARSGSNLPVLRSPHIQHQEQQNYGLLSAVWRTGWENIPVAEEALCQPPDGNCGPWTMLNTPLAQYDSVQDETHFNARLQRFADVAVTRSEGCTETPEGGEPRWPVFPPQPLYAADQLTLYQFFRQRVLPESLNPWQPALSGRERFAHSSIQTAKRYLWSLMRWMRQHLASGLRAYAGLRRIAGHTIPAVRKLTVHEEALPANEKAWLLEAAARQRESQQRRFSAYLADIVREDGSVQSHLEDGAIRVLELLLHFDLTVRGFDAPEARPYSCDPALPVTNIPVLALVIRHVKSPNLLPETSIIHQRLQNHYIGTRSHPKRSMAESGPEKSIGSESDAERRLRAARALALASFRPKHQLHHPESPDARAIRSQKQIEDAILAAEYMQPEEAAGVRSMHTLSNNVAQNAAAAAFTSCKRNRLQRTPELAANMRLHTLLRRKRRATKSLAALSPSSRLKLHGSAATPAGRNSGSKNSPSRLISLCLSVRRRESDSERDRRRRPSLNAGSLSKSSVVRRLNFESQTARPSIAAPVDQDLSLVSPSLPRWIDRQLLPNLPPLVSQTRESQQQGLSSCNSTAHGSRAQTQIAKITRDVQIHRFASTVSVRSVLAQALQMRDWHSFMQTIVPAASTEVPLNNKHASRSDTFYSGWRIEFESKFPPVNKVLLREALLGKSLIWMLDLTAVHFRSKLKPHAIASDSATQQQGRIKLHALISHEGIHAMTAPVILDLGFSDSVLLLQTPLPAWLDARSASQGALWQARIISWLDFITTYADIKHFRQMWGPHSFLSERTPTDTCENWLRRFPCACGPRPVSELLDTSHMMLATDPSVSTPSKATEIDHERLELSRTIRKKAELITRGPKILIGTCSAVIKQFNAHIRTLDPSGPELEANWSDVVTRTHTATSLPFRIQQAMQAAFGSAPERLAPRKVFKRDQIQIQRLSEQVQLLNQLVRMSDSRRRMFLQKSAQWRKLILHDSNPFIRRHVQAGLMSQTNLSIDALSGQNRWRNSILTLYHRLSADLASLVERQQQHDKEKLSRRLNTMFRSRLSYVIQSIFAPRCEGPKVPNVQAQADYFAKRFECLFFGPNRSNENIGLRNQRFDEGSRSSSSATEVLIPASTTVDIHWPWSLSMPVSEPSVAATTSHSVWAEEHTRRRTFSRAMPKGFSNASCLTSGTVRAPDLDTSNQASKLRLHLEPPGDAGHRPQTNAMPQSSFRRSLKRACTNGAFYNEADLECIAHDLIPMWQPESMSAKALHARHETASSAQRRMLRSTTQKLDLERATASAQRQRDEQEAQFEQVIEDSDHEQSDAFDLSQPDQLNSSSKRCRLKPRISISLPYEFETPVVRLVCSARDIPLQVQTIEELKRSTPQWSPLSISDPASDLVLRQIADTKPVPSHLWTQYSNLRELAETWRDKVGFSEDTVIDNSHAKTGSQAVRCENSTVVLGQLETQCFPAARKVWFDNLPPLPHGIALVVTDGSCSQSGTGGYAGIVVVHPDCSKYSACQGTDLSSCRACKRDTRCTRDHHLEETPDICIDKVASVNAHFTIVAGGARNTTSGTMELTAVLRSVHYIHCHLRLIKGLFILTDYMALVQCSWQYDYLLDWRTHTNGFLWERIHALFSHFERGVSLSHVKSHQDDIAPHLRPWKSMMNEQADCIAKLASKAVEQAYIPESAAPTTVLSRHASWTHDHARATFLSTITTDEMKLAIAFLNIKSAPGPDGVPLKIFRLFDTENIELLRQEFEQVRLNSALPAEWKVSRITLIFKKGDPLMVENWRPITVQKAITLLFSKIMAQRLLRLLWQLGAIPMTQKCNVQNISGVNEHSFLIRAMLEDMQTKARLGVDATLIVVFTDVAKAFDSVQRGSLLHVLRSVLGDVHPFIDLIGNMYEDVSIILTDSDDQAIQMPKQAGIHQGDALSAILYIILVEDVRRDYEGKQASQTGYAFHGDSQRLHLVTKTDYEDDDNQVFGSIDEARKGLAGLAPSMRRHHLLFNSSKTLVLAIRTTQTGGLEDFDPELDIDGARLPALKLHQKFAALGLILTATNDTQHGEVAAVTKFFRAMAQLDACLLDVGRKLYLLQLIVNPKIEHHFRSIHFPAETLQRLDETQLSMVRKWLGADGFRINTAFIRAPAKEGGLGLPSLRDRWEVLYLSNFAHVVSAHDPILRNAVWSIIHTSQIGKVWVEGSHTRPVIRSRLVTMSEQDLKGSPANIRGLLAQPNFFAWAPLPIATHRVMPELEQSSPSREPIRKPIASPAANRGYGSTASARMAVQYARLAHKLEVGFTLPWEYIVREQNDRTRINPDLSSHAYGRSPTDREPHTAELCMSLGGNEIDGPFELSRELTQKLHQRYSEELAKQKVVHGKIHLHQGISHLPCLTTAGLTRLFLSHSCEYYSDREVGIILKAQLDLWPTASQLAKCGLAGSAGDHGRRCCHCHRQNETVSHLLTIAKNETAGEILHPEPLASLATQRHNRIVRSITTQLAGSGLYTFVAEEKRILLNDLSQDQLASRLVKPPSSVRFSKPDIVLVYGSEALGLGPANCCDLEPCPATRRPVATCFLVDVICAGDEHVLLEHEIGYQHLVDNLHQFNEYGMSRHAPVERAALQRGPRIPVLIERTQNTRGRNQIAETFPISYSPTASKLAKYSAYAQYVRELGLECEVVPLTFGVRGFVPQATFNHVMRLTQPNSPIKPQSHLAKKVLVPIMHIIFSAIIKTYGAWQSSNPSSAPLPAQ